MSNILKIMPFYIAF